MIPRPRRVGSYVTSNGPPRPSSWIHRTRGIAATGIGCLIYSTPIPTIHPGYLLHLGDSSGDYSGD
ncbi:hypothetical protein FIBSPDRAFT_497408 [Athelia psychrophila]|uniref:Uncharacterized protein n=1 Tax=Athelia psychrophila TaxID=1759441 RepID=A0A166KDT0_9AGAM|nr:hypothetical protein FIBSPDRAFT_497408 [Fibularhizoctonia sp. CBS 109695]